MASKKMEIHVIAFSGGIPVAGYVAEAWPVYSDSGMCQFKRMPEREWVQLRGDLVAEEVPQGTPLPVDGLQARKR